MLTAVDLDRKMPPVGTKRVPTMNGTIFVNCVLSSLRKGARLFDWF